MISEISEQELIKEVLGDFINLEIPNACDFAIQDLKQKNDKNIIVKKLVINIIKLLWRENKFEYGHYLSQNKNIIVNGLYNMYTGKTQKNF